MTKDLAWEATEQLLDQAERTPIDPALIKNFLATCNTKTPPCERASGARTHSVE